MAAISLGSLIENVGVLIADDNAYMRRLTRTMLMNVGARAIYEASDGVAALDIVRTANPDIMLLDWDLPVLSGPEVISIVRSPGVFPKPNLPIIMLTALGQRSRVNEALRLGVHEFLLKPTSPMALRDRLASILIRPRPMMKIGNHYVPKPRVLPNGGRFNLPTPAIIAAV